MEAENLSLLFQPEDNHSRFLPKCRRISTTLQGVTLQKTMRTISLGARRIQAASVATQSCRGIQLAWHNDGCSPLLRSHIIVRCFIHYCHFKNDYLFVAFLKTPSNSTGYAASSEVARK